jgi:glycosyltransferase involved in cell wall biosynthesis
MKANDIHVLMFGWEYPPFNSGGLGTACHGLTNALADRDVDVAFVLPRKVTVSSSKIKMAFADNRYIDNEYTRYLFNPYISTSLFETIRKKLKVEHQVSNDLIQEVQKYSVNARNVAKKINHNIIHAHDWLSFGAGIEAKQVSKKPLVVHIHATELDRTGFNSGHPYIYHVEKEGMKRADRVIAVSGYTKKLLVKHYGVPAHKVDVVHNGINLEDYQRKHEISHLKNIFGKIVLFVGRLTLQKGPDYFLRAAQKVLQHTHDVTFVIAGSGDAETEILQEASRMGISHKLFFTGFLRGDDLNKLFQAADLFVMPSVSEPFGIAALEAVANGTPALVSKQSGVSEVLTHALKTDFWDINDMANKILAILEYDSLGQTLRHNGTHEVKKSSWHQSAQKCIEVYNRVLA